MVCDGVSDNRKMFSLHGCGDKTIHKIINVYGKEDHSIIFFSDPSHLIKIVQNRFSRVKLCFKNTIIVTVNFCTLLFQYNGQTIDWKFIVKLYQRNIGALTHMHTPGLSLTHKLKYEHIYFTSFSKMRVDLAVQA